MTSRAKKRRKMIKLLLHYIPLFLIASLPLFALSNLPSHPNTLLLSETEKAWLHEHPTIKVGMDSAYAPYEWINQNGMYVGMAVDYLHLLEKKLGVHFEIAKGKSWSQIVEMGKKGEIDMITSVVQTPERLNYFVFSNPYNDTQTMIVDRGEGSFIGNLENLSSRRVAVEKGSYTQELLKKNYPYIQLILANSILEALYSVINGKADAYVGDLSAINYAIKNNGLETLRFSGQIALSSQHRFAFPKNNTEFASIMTKAMASISKEESDAIFNRWLGMRIERGIHTKTLIKYSVGLVCLFLLFGYWYYRLHREIRYRKAVEMRERRRNSVLEMIAKMLPLHEILESIVKEVEMQNPKMICSILLLNKEGNSFCEVIAPHLPDFYNDAINGLFIGEGLGSCGTAAYRKERVIVEDIATHPYWEKYKEVALRAGVQACWSEPIFASDRTVLGTFAIYHTRPQTPSVADNVLIEQSANLASIAIEKSVAATKLKESEELYRHLTEEISDVIWRTDKDLIITYISPSDERIRGYKAAEVIGHHVFEMFTPEGVSIILENMERRAEAEKNGIRTNFVTYEIQHRSKDGKLIWGEIISKPERNEKGEIIGYHGITREISERKAMQDRVQQLAFYDPLTKLPNRLLLKERLNSVMYEMKRTKKYSALFFIDLDNFKSLNDTQGHNVGDVLLSQVAQRLKECIREVDTVARFGGDEFVVILDTLHEDKKTSIAQAHVIAEKMRLSISALYLLRIPQEREEHVVEHRCTASIGVLVFNSEEGSQDDLLKRADTAMYRAKAAGRDQISFYDLDT